MQPTPVFLPGEFQGQGAWWDTVHGVTKSWTRQRNRAHDYWKNLSFFFVFFFVCLFFCFVLFLNFILFLNLT